MSAAMRTFFGGLLVGLSAQWTWGQDTFGFDGVIRHFAVGTNSVYVVTDDRLYQLGHKLTLLQTRYQRGLQVDCKNMDGQCFHKVSEMDHWNATFTVNTLLPFIENNTLITCGKTVCGYCELLDLNNISKIVHEEIIDVGSVIPKGLSVGILVDLKHDPSNSETYILTAQANSEECKTDMEAVTLYNTLDQQKGGIFSKTGFDGSPRIRSKHMDVEFVDGFQINTTIFLFSILPSVKLGGIRLIWLQSRINKLETFKSLAGATLNSSEAGIIRTRLLSSSVIPGGPPVHWAGVFSANDTGNPVNTVLAIYDINLPLFNRTLMDPDFCPTENCDFKKFDSIPDLKPMIIVFKYSSMTSVLAVKKYTWVVFIIGTGDGQLIKIAVDKSYKATCPQVFHLEDNASPVFRTMYLDPVDPKYVYVALTDQMKRIPLAKCGAYNTLDDCWNAQDPFCGWCETTSRCTFEDECLESTWMSISQDPSQKNMVSYQVEMVNSGQGIKLTLQIHLSVRGKNISAFSCNILPNPSSSLSYGEDMRHCYCVYSAHHLSAGGLKVSVRLRVGKVQLVKQLILTNCSAITGPPTYALCQQCITAGCSWNNNVCSWTHNGSIQDACQINMSGIIHHPVITSVTPNVLSLYGSNSVLLSGINLSNVTMVRMQQDMACSSKESHVWNNTGVSLMFRVPAGDKGIVRLCAVLPDGSCHGSARITYGPSPVCTSLDPDSSWASGKRIIGVKGLNMKFVDFVSDHNSRKIQSSSAETLEYPSSSAEGRSRTYVSLRVANQSLACPTLLTYHPDPTFISFTSTKKGNDLSITIQKKADSLHLRPEELHVLGVEGERQYNCVRTTIEPSNETDSVVCEIPNSHEANIQFLKITYGDVTVSVDSPQSFYPLMLLLLLLFPLILGVGLFIYFNEQKKHREQMNDRLEMLECDIRKEIRQGFVDLQTEKSDLIENNGAIPFLDYKHFASRIFFPEGGSLVTSCIKDIGQDGVNVQPDEPCQNLSKLIQNPLYLTSMIHALEEQKGFTVKDKCAVASLLTVALHGNLPYLTQIIEVLLRNLMEKANTQPKLMLRRTESIVEKLLTNWMSICLYGFLRESVGQHLFLLVSALSQQIAKGPVDSVTEKALYTLNEDWLLWQAQDFSSLKLMVLFAVGTDGEVSEPLEVNTLDCDTVEQVKEKILMAFNAKFGFPYNTPLRDLRIEYERDKTFVALNEVDASSVVIGDVTMLNTLKHYKIPDGASIKVISRGTHPSLCHQSSVKEDENFSTKYFHLIDPEVYQDQERNPERKKIKLKEVHLTKLLSTKVAIHSFVENLFKTIWGTTNGKAPHAVKFFFDFLDAQADGKKISDPDVLHIWKTNSLPLRFWVNILKNPQFVFDMEKTPHMDSCLSVIAQAFMDSFSLSENQLGKHAPTNKLLYAKDIPQYKQEVKAYYKQIRDQPPITNTEFKDFLLEESKKHDNEFNESVALRALYKYVHQYFNEIKQTLEQNEAPAELTQQLQHVKIQFDSLKSCSWH